MGMTYFDSSDPFASAGVADVDRVYRFAWDAFETRHWDDLDRVYERLPGWRGLVPIPVPGWRGRILGRKYTLPFWFGTDVQTSPHLTASVEPPGLQVTGLLPAAEFQRWHEQFLEAIAAFPAGQPN